MSTVALKRYPAINTGFASSSLRNVAAVMLICAGGWRLASHRSVEAVYLDDSGGEIRMVAGVAEMHVT